MLSTRWSRWDPVSGFRNEVDRLFTGFLADPAEAFARNGGYPALNVWEDAESVHIEAEVPGLKMSDLEAVVDDNDLTIRGKRVAAGDKNVSFHRQERGVGAFTRTVRLPIAIDADHVDAKLTHGVLSIKLAKAPEARPRRIEVKAAD